MTLIASMLGPALTSIALATEPPPAPWSMAVDLGSLPAASAAQESCAVTALGDDLADSATRQGLPSDEFAPSDALRWVLAFAGLAAIATVRKSRP